MEPMAFCHVRAGSVVEVRWRVAPVVTSPTVTLSVTEGIMSDMISVGRHYIPARTRLLLTIGRDVPNTGLFIWRVPPLVPEIKYLQFVAELNLTPDEREMFGTEIAFRDTSSGIYVDPDPDASTADAIAVSHLRERDSFASAADYGEYVKTVVLEKARAGRGVRVWYVGERGVGPRDAVVQGAAGLFVSSVPFDPPAEVVRFCFAFLHPMPPSPLLPMFTLYVLRKNNLPAF